MAASDGTGAARGAGAMVARGLGALDGAIARVEGFILAYGIILMAANSIANVIGRFGFGRSLYFAEEVNRFLIVLVTFVGLGYAARKGRHIRMSAFYDQLSDRQRKLLMIVIAGVTSAVMFVLAYYSYLYVANVARLGRVTPSLQLPLYLTYLWVPLGFAITGIQYALTVVRNLLERDVYVSYQQIDSYDETDYSPSGPGPAGATEPGADVRGSPGPAEPAIAEPAEPAAAEPSEAAAEPGEPADRGERAAEPERPPGRPREGGP